MLYYMNWLTHDFWTRTGGWEFDRSHGAGISSPSHWQQVEEQVPKPVGWMMCFLLMTFVPIQKLCVNIYIIGILHGYVIRSGRRPEGSQWPPGGPQVCPGRWLPEGRLPDRITSPQSIPFIQYKYIVNTTIVKLWNYKSNDLPKNGLPMCAWHCQSSYQLNKVSEGRRPEHLLNNPRTVLNLQLRSSIYMSLFRRNVQHIALNPTKNLSIVRLISLCIRVVKVLSDVLLMSARIRRNNNGHIIVTSQ